MEEGELEGGGAQGCPVGPTDTLEGSCADLDLGRRRAVVVGRTGDRSRRQDTRVERAADDDADPALRAEGQEGVEGPLIE